MPDARAGLPAATADGAARQAALGIGGPPPGDASVTYASHGRLLLLGPESAVLAAVARVPETLDPYVLLTDDAGARPSHPDVGALGARALRATPGSLAGHLGAFRASIADGAGEADLAAAFGLEPEQAFDLVIDLHEPPLLRRQLNPPGYFSPRGPEGVATAIARAAELVGEFEKPRYFAYDADICVHGARGRPGCSACLDACATEAIRSLGETIEVDPYLCQGCGSCSTVCPTGAIRYAWPAPASLAEHLRELLRSFRGAGGSRPVILFHDGEAGAAAVERWAPDMPESVLPVEVEDTGSVGIDVWLPALAYGASRVLIALPAALPASERAATQQQIEIADAMLGALGFPSARIAAIEPEGRIEVLAEVPAPLVEQRTNFAPVGSKREIVHKALLHLHAAAGAPAAVAPLPAGAAWGEVQVDRDACTLCMACVSVCPTQALIGGGETPALSFREDRCVQCRLCERSCPEDAITLSPRIDFGALAEPTARLRNEEEPHYCPGCGKQFGTAKLIERTEQRLSAHWMFGDAKARFRLRLCADCRVEAVLRDEGSIAPYKGE